MRIALFSGNYNYLREGANQALNRLVDYIQAKRGFEVRVYSPVSDQPAFEPAGTLVPVPSIALPVRSEFRLALGLAGSIRQDVRAFAPDLVHLSTPDILGSRAQSLAKRMRVPIVASQHTRFETYPAYYGLGWLTPVAQAHLRRFYRRADHVLCPTPVLAADMMKLRGDGKVSVWSRGVDRTLFSPTRRDREWRRRLGVDDEEIILLFFGRLVLEKGIGLFIEVVRALQAKNALIRPLVVGEGPARGLFDKVPASILTGHLEGEELARAIASADIMLTPSTTETFGNVILEAMASGLAVVSADAPNARAIITDGETGLICPPLDIAAYGAAVTNLIGDPDRRQALGRAAEQASRDFSWDSASESVALAYETLVSEKRSA